MTHSRFLLALGVSAALGAAALAQNRTFTNQYTFGDSLSDNGNAFALGGTLLNPGPPVYVGGRWSNGPTFAERLGNNLALGGTAPTSVKSSMNFAFGSAATTQALNNGGSPVPALPQQLQLFQSHAVSVQRTDLFTVWFGANDILVTAGQQPGTALNPAAMDVAGANAARATAGLLQSLIGLGAKNILVFNMPDIGLTPTGLSSGAGTFLTRGSLAYNAEFEARLAAVAAGASDVTITRIDAGALIAQMQRDFRALGYANATSGLILPASAGGGGDPNGYVFFDGVHPSARTHALLAEVALEALNPEPVLGFAGTLGSSALALQGLGATALDARASQLAFSPRGAGRVDAYASFNYSDGGRSRDAWRPKFDYQAQVVTAGVDGRLSDGVFFGGALNVGRLTAAVSGGAGDYTVEDAAGRLYGLWRGGPVSLLIDGDYGTLNFKGIHRRTAFGGLATNGKTGGDHWGVGLKAAWSVDVGGTTVRPWAGLRTQRVTLDGYTEKDIATLTMDFAAQEAKSTTGAIGVDASFASKFGGHGVRLDLRGAWHDEIGSKTRNVAGRLANNFTRPTTIALEDGDGGGVELGGAASLFFAKNWSASLGYAAEIRPSEKLTNRFSLSVQTGF
jgi:outer membrane lipase/esterase